MHAARALRAPHRRRRVVRPAELALGALQLVLAFAEVREPESPGQHLLLDARVRAVGARALQPRDRELGWDLRVGSDQRRVAERRDHQLELEPVVVQEAQRALAALTADPL